MGVRMLAALVALSLLGLLLGPILASLGAGRRQLAAALDGITLGLVPALIVTRLLPHTWSSIGGWSLVCAASGFSLLWAADSLHHFRASRLAQFIVVPALAVHALSDGASLAVAVSARQAGGAGLLLGVAVVLHRLPEGLFLATTLEETAGRSRVRVYIAALAFAMVVGALLARWLLSHVPESTFDGITAFGLGAMLRLVLHTHGDRPEGTSSRATSGIAMAAGVALSLAVPAPTDVFRLAQPYELPIAQTIVPLFIETAPALLLGVVATALLHVWIPRLPVPALATGSAALSALRGIRFGVGLPICSCGVRPMSRRLVLAGAPTSAAVAFALATPEIGLDALPMSIRLLGIRLTLVRILVAVTMALVIALLVDRAANASTASFGPPPAPEDIDLGPIPKLPSTLVATFDHVGAWYLAGLVVAAAIEAALPYDLATRLPAQLVIGVVVLVGLPTYLGAPGATPIAAMLLHKGFSPGVVIAFLAIGSTVNAAVLTSWRDLLGLRAAIVGALGALAFALCAGLLMHRFFPASATPALHPLVAHVHAPFELASAFVVAVALALSVTRLGARGFLESLFGEIGARDEACDHPEHAGHHAHGHSHR